MTTMMERARTAPRMQHHLRPLRFMPVAALAVDVAVIAAVAGVSSAGRQYLEVFPNPFNSQPELGTAGLLIGRFALRQAVQSTRRRDHRQMRVLMYGTPRQVDEIGAG
ncbi:hypothetical protein E8D34_05630 [Nocardioides sp. GY 10113]|uniref:hypothetical protein n=1 Tax=Nocardioides sp. GY 10113 TaxID=2569761 RepID=UPI0010A88797|nr:hypothetical protein [Nocardioides sp. GY 10113]TIC88405.1 hypothetical protein E8D34_05630 [Nocardioides sp. GY 10113]